MPLSVAQLTPFYSSDLHRKQSGIHNVLLQHLASPLTVSFTQSIYLTPTLSVCGVLYTFMGAMACTLVVAFSANECMHPYSCL